MSKLNKKRKNYSEDQLSKALDEVRNGRPVKTVSREYGIPKTTLSNKYRRTVLMNLSLRPPTILSEEEENELVCWIFNKSKHGVHVTKDQLLNSVTTLTKQLQRETPFKDGYPGQEWYNGFMRRHPDVSTNVVENLTHRPISLIEDGVREWFNEVELYLKEKNLLNIEATRIFNCDDSEFSLMPNYYQVLIKEEKHIMYNLLHNDEEEYATVFFTSNAIGTLAPPMINLNQEHNSFSTSENESDSCDVGKMPNTWMASETFFEYISNVFEPWLTANDIQRPVILYLNGHSSHLTMALNDFCCKKNIELIGLYPDSTHIMQPLKVAFFDPLKTSWEKVVRKWFTDNGSKQIQKEDIAQLILREIETFNVSKIISNGFRKCGLHPFNAKAIDYYKRDNCSISTNFGTSVNPPKINQNSDEAKIFLELLEERIGATLLQNFHTAKVIGKWEGDLRHDSLFNLWLNASEFEIDSFQYLS